MNVLLYGAVVLIWGTTWLAIAVQSRYLPPVAAVFWRFAVALAVLWAGLWLAGHVRRLPWRDQLACAAQGACVFCCNFVCLYMAVRDINSGLLSVIFSLSLWFNAFNARLFFAQPPPRHFLLSACMGLLGMVALFAPDILASGQAGNWWRGMTWALAGTYLFSLGNMLSLRHQRRGLDVFTSNAWAMLYGTLWLALLAGWLGQAPWPPRAGAFWLATAHVAVLGTVVGFAAYFLLVGRIGAARAAYAMLLTPLVALAVSTLWEGYQWHAGGIMGLALIAGGNVLLFAGRRGG